MCSKFGLECRFPLFGALRAGFLVVCSLLEFAHHFLPFLDEFVAALCALFGLVVLLLLDEAAFDHVSFRPSDELVHMTVEAVAPFIHYNASTLIINYYY